VDQGAPAEAAAPEEEAAVTSDKAYALEQRLNQLGLFTDANGVDAYTTDADGNTWQLGAMLLYGVGSGGFLTVDSASPVTIGDLSFDAAAGFTYYVRGKVSFTEQASSGAAAFRFQGLDGCTATGMSVSNWFGQQSSTATLYPDDLTGLGADAESGTMADGATLTWWYEGIIQVGAAGTLALQTRATGGSSCPFQVNAYPIMYVRSLN
jgi:hypothetical protein